ncbi:MAG TPA: hypothetical protein VLJ39_11005, partial [Tepidisphaeraceae bacterium]|nr:hypothetical protein [Tepidisphaeraceae bacterium]
MSARYITIAGALIAMVVCIVRPAAAQLSPDEPAGGGVAGSASAVLERQPTVLRLQLLISADGKDTKEALSKLKE